MSRNDQSVRIFSLIQCLTVSSDHPVSIVGGVVSVNFFSFSTSSLEPLNGIVSNFVWMFLEWTPTKFVKMGCYPYF